MAAADAGVGQDASACEGVLARSMLALFECEDPPTLERAVELVCPDLRPSGELFDAVADAWERYRHVREMPWD